MNWKFWCTNPTKAARRYQRRLGAVMMLYLTSVYSVTGYLHGHPQARGGRLYLLASVPAIDVVAMLVIVGLYLREEVDEFKRYQLALSILWAVGGTLAMTAFTDFLRSYGAIGALPPFTEFAVFWVLMAVAQAVQMLRNRVGNDESAA